MEIFLLAVLLGLVPAVIAQGKGRSFGLWWLYGAVLFIVALPHSLIMSANTKALEQEQLSAGMKKCPFCAELIKGEAVVCRYCGRELAEAKAQSREAPVNAPLSVAQPSDSQLMETYGVTFDGERYCYESYRYDNLADAVSYAKSQSVNSKKKLYGGLAVGAVVVALLAFFAFKPKGESEEVVQMRTQLAELQAKQAEEQAKLAGETQASQDKVNKLKQQQSEAKSAVEQARDRRDTLKSTIANPQPQTIPMVTAVGRSWKYQSESDKMDSSTTNQAIISSSNTFELDFPYQGKQIATLMLRKGNRTGTDAMLIVNKGQINTGIDGGSLLIRFDASKPQKYSISRPSDHSSNIVFIKNISKFVHELKASKKMLVEVEFFNNGLKTLEFNTEGLQWN